MGHSRRFELVNRHFVAQLVCRVAPPRSRHRSRYLLGGPQQRDYSGLPTQQSDIARDGRRLLRGCLDARSIADRNRSFGDDR
jgi:hypothetical protein